MTSNEIAVPNEEPGLPDVLRAMATAMEQVDANAQRAEAAAEEARVARAEMDPVVGALARGMWSVSLWTSKHGIHTNLIKFGKEVTAYCRRNSIHYEENSAVGAGGAYWANSYPPEAIEAVWGAREFWRKSR